MTSPLSQSQLSIYLACQGLRPEDGNYQQASLYKLPESIPLEKFARAMVLLCQTPREYVDMIFDMLRSMGYLQMNA